MSSVTRKTKPTSFPSHHNKSCDSNDMVEIRWIIYFTVCGASCLAQNPPRKEQTFDDVQEAVFSRGVYPNPGDIPVLNRKVFRAMRVSVSEHPYVVSIRRLHAHYLTGVILAAHTVVSVAHPVYNVPLNELGVVAGENYNERGSAYMTVLLVVAHQDFDPYTLLADLALLRLFEAIFAKVTQKPIPLFTEFRPQQTSSSKMHKSRHFAQKAFVTGWGRCDWMGTELCLPRSSVYFPDEKQDPMLQTISFNHSLLVESPYCVGYDKHMIPLKRQRGMLCVGPAREEQPLAPCLAVPGAPLTVLGRLAGLQSWGFSCGYTHDLPPVYTDVRYYRDWLQWNMGILQSLDPDQVSELYIATKAYIIQDWLMQTSDQRPAESHHHDMQIRTTHLDQWLIDLRGNVTDFRDYAYGGKHRQAKTEMYAILKMESENKLKLLEISEQLRRQPARPFLNEEFSEFIMNDTIESVKGAHDSNN